MGGEGAGSLNWRCEGMDGFLYYWNSEASRNLHREQTSVFLKNGDVIALIINYRFPKGAQIDDTAYDCRSRIEDKHQSIRHVFVFICRRKLSKCVLYFKLQRP